MRYEILERSRRLTEWIFVFVFLADRMSEHTFEESERNQTMLNKLRMEQQLKMTEEVSVMIHRQLLAEVLIILINRSHLSSASSRITLIL
jgi:hypothetical protein